MKVLGGIFKNERRYKARRVGLFILMVSFGVELVAIADWTVLVYVQARNNLSNFAYKNFTDMATIGSGENLNVLVQWYQPDQKGIWRYKIEKGKMVLDTCLASDADGTKTSDLVESMKWAVNKCPAKKYSLILWNHGLGIIDPKWGNQRPWKGSGSSRFSIDQSVLSDNPRIQIEGLTTSTDYMVPSCDFKSTSTLLGLSQEEDLSHRAILFNEQSKTYMNNQSLSQALSEIKTNVLNNNKIDLLGMDACLMAMLEVGYQTMPYAKYLVASQEVELANGWNYSAFLKGLSEKFDECNAAKVIVKSYEHFYKDKIQFYTQSAMDLASIPLVKSSIDSLVQNLKISFASNKDVTRDVILRARRSCVQFSASSYIDLHSFCVELEKHLDAPDIKNKIKYRGIEGLKSSLSYTKKMIEQSVIAYAVGKNLSKARGLSIYFPVSHIDESYQYTDFARDCGWHDFLKELTN